MPVTTIFRAALIAVGALALPAHAAPNAIARTEIENAKPLLIQALNAKDGEAHGVLVGEMAEAITGHFAATSPIFIDVTTLKRYRQAGCARLNVTFWQEGVRLPETKTPRRQTVEFGINYCLDGLPPKSLQ
ncbi:MAG: hypothetical protein LBI92_10265 [Azoarcus sp.]|jgi:hypothetical protein|nr:hypothetical protein [Azoarcus sp.]